LRTEQSIIFEPYRLDLANECLWKGAQAIKLRPKVFAVLEYLVSRPKQLLTKEEVLSAVWPETFVGKAVLKKAIGQIRQAIGDDPKSPRFIETAHRRGYRFIGPMQDNTASVAVKDSGIREANVAERVVGREKALSRLEYCLEKVLAGERQTIFVTGEAGIGKTALVDTFIRRITAGRSIRIGRGQCLEQYGTCEAYFPVLDAIGRLGREHARVVDVLRAHAPMWLLQMPRLVNASDRAILSRELVNATGERMLREMADALEVLAAEVPLVLILEDLHWSDYSTLDLISYLARQRHMARLMVIGTYRTAELLVSGHPLRAVKRELLPKQQCAELPLEYLSAEAVRNYLTVRFPGNRFPAKLADLIHQRTDGNPLFMVNAVDFLVKEDFIRQEADDWQFVQAVEKIEVKMPDSIKQMIEKQLDRLAESERRTLEAASIAGVKFNTIVLAAALGEDSAHVEERCDELARRQQFIQDSGIQILPNGKAVSRYGFIHALYQNVLYERASWAKRIQLHLRIGLQGEALYGEYADEIAAELAVHFDRGADHGRSVQYLQKTAGERLSMAKYRSFQQGHITGES
jgi:predicted ATPase/DNA-binding winged helix-turn-helix (wHTH) protein